VVKCFIAYLLLGAKEGAVDGRGADKLDGVLVDGKETADRSERGVGGGI